MITGRISPIMVSAGREAGPVMRKLGLHEWVATLSDVVTAKVACQTIKCTYCMTVLCIITVRVVQYCEVTLSVEVGGKNDFHTSKIWRCVFEKINTPYSTLRQGLHTVHAVLRYLPTPRTLTLGLDVPAVRVNNVNKVQLGDAVRPGWPLAHWCGV